MPDTGTLKRSDGQQKVAIIAPGEVFGGAERQLLYLMSFLRRSQQICILICFYDRDFAQRARALGVPTHVLPARPIVRWDNARKIAALLRSSDVDVVHVNGYKATAYALMVRLLTKFQVVKTEHGRLEVSPRGSISDLKPRIFRVVENIASRLLGAHVVYVTEDLRNDCLKEHARLATYVIPNGIDFSEIDAQARPRELTSSTWNAVVVGRLEPVKGIEYAIRALADTTIPEHVCLWIVGEGPLMEQLQRLAASLELTQRVRFTGFRRDAVAFIAHADALLMPSLHEGLPYTLLEAVAARTAVIASDVGGLSEILVDGRTALLVRPGDVATLARSIARLVAEPMLASALADAAHASLSQRHDIECMGQAYSAVYTIAQSGMSGVSSAS